MLQLVALDLPGGPDWVDALRRAWDDGDAVLPIDPRLPPSARSALLRELRPTALVDAQGKHRLADGRKVEPGDAAVIATSGTTGAPKGVVLTHAAIQASGLTTSSRLAVEPGHDHWLACLPLAHVGGFSVVTRALVTNTALTVLPGFDVETVNAAVLDMGPAGPRPTLVSLVVNALLRIQSPSWRVILVGGSALPDNLPVNTVRTYGMTETGSGIVYDGWPLDGVELRIDAAGQIEVRSPTLLRAYRLRSVDIDPKTADGWFATGDSGSIAPNCRVTVKGRSGDVIVTGAEKVWPEMVERVLANAPGVRDVAIAGRADPEWGARVVAFVVALDPTTPPTLESLRTYAKATLPAYAAPKELVLVESVARTALGKVVRRALRPTRP